MARHINSRHKNFLAELQAKMKERYKPNYSHGYSESDRQHAEMIGVDLPEPVAPAIPDRHGQHRHQQNISIDAFEAEYEAFIANLKAQKQKQENKEEAVTNVSETDAKTEQAVEETQAVEDKSKKTKKKKKPVETVKEESVAEEIPVAEEPVVEQAESPVYLDAVQTEAEKSDLL